MSRAKILLEQFRVSPVPNDITGLGLEVLELPNSELAAVTGLAEYADIHLFRELFYEFILDSNYPYANWKDAFKAMMSALGIPTNQNGYTQEQDIRRILREES